MSTNPKTAAVAALTEPCSRRRLDPIDLPARALGAKRAALQVRRQRPTGRPKGSQAVVLEPGVLTLASKDETVVFKLRTTALGLVMERTLRQVVGTRLIQVLVFADQTTFDRWCASEPMRFEDALLYSQLRREGHAALTPLL